MPTPDTAPPSARVLTRSITATWWYTAGGVIFFELAVLLTWIVMGASVPSIPAAIGLLAGGALWVLASALQLADYRAHRDPEATTPRLRVWAPLVVATLFGIAVGIYSQTWTLAVAPLAQSLMLMPWKSGRRPRLLGLIFVVMTVLAVIDISGRLSAPGASDAFFPVAFTVLLPLMTVTSLWWWDVLVALDLARASEARLAATQERLRVATDVHDLQGHHLQVIALQLELAERLHANDPEAALAQLQAARVSVADARQGTRDLATRFRSVPLGDELANARDLLTAAGLSVETDIGQDPTHAPGAVLGPVIRETTTNVLRHGAGRRARMSLHHDGAAWVYEIANDSARASTHDDGSGLDGIRRRLADAGGSLKVTSGDEFIVTAIVPADAEGRA